MQRVTLGFALIGALFAGCGETRTDDAETAAEESIRPDVERAVAVLHPTDGSSVRGVVRFTRENDGVRISAEISGLSPGRHGFHIHEYGDLTDPKAESAGGHYNPTGAKHGAPTDDERHAGDLGNIEAGADGVAVLEMKDPRIELTGARSILGRAVVVHEKTDDFQSQPTGDAGGRLAAGVVGIAR